MILVSRTAALHIAFWHYDPWYRRAWIIWPQAVAMLLAGWLLADRGALPVATWGAPVDCTNPANPGCASSRRAVYFFDTDEISKPSIANQTTVMVNRSTFQNSDAADHPKLSAALGAYYRHEWARAVEILKSANAGDPNVQYLTGLALLAPGTTDQTRDAQTLLRSAAASNHQAAALLGRILFIGWVPKDAVAGRKLIEDAAAAGDAYAMRLLAAGYVNGEFGGTFDPVKAVDLLRRAAEAGDPVAMAQLAYSIHTGRAGLTRDEADAVAWLRRSAEAGYLHAQFTLGKWFTDRYTNRESADPSEGIMWYERAYQRGLSIPALVSVANLHRYATTKPWADTRRFFDLLQLCAPYKAPGCHFALARAYHDGAGTQRDLVKSYAHYTIAEQVGLAKEFTAEKNRLLDSKLQPADKTAAAWLTTDISAGLKPRPQQIEFEAPEALAAGPSPFAAPPSAGN
jgi:TPR repeat protein